MGPYRMSPAVVVVVAVASVLASTARAAPAAAATGADTAVGLVDPDQGRWHLRDLEGDVRSFFFGNPGDIPIMGDWDCDGIDTPGMYRQSDGFVYLSNANDSQTADVRFFFGNPGDLPLAGDFDGDGCDTVSIYRPAEGRVFIIDRLGENEGGLGAATTDYYFGNPGDKPFVGDFDGDGFATVGLHRESTGLVYFNNEHRSKIADHQFIFGDPGDRLVAGDWTGDAHDSPALFRPGDTTFYFRHTNTEGVADDLFEFGRTEWLPVAGVFGDLEASPPEPAAFTAAEVDYFVDIALGAEFGGSSPRIHKWLTDVRIAVHGSPTPADLDALDDVIADLNRLIDSVDVVRSDGSANVDMHFAPLAALPGILPQYVPGNYGFVWTWWGGASGAMSSATVLIATDVTAPVERAHLIREELTQGLGLLNDSHQYPDSIFQQEWTTVTGYAPIDEAVISILYDPRIEPLMDEHEVRAAIG